MIGLFLEDIAHERFITSLVKRIASETGVQVAFDVRNATGGIPQMRGQLSTFLRQHAQISSSYFDVLIVTQDTDCRGETTIKNEVQSEVRRAGYPGDTIVASPAPHIESWYLADPTSLQALMSMHRLPQIPRGDCERDQYKSELSSIFQNSPLGGGIEYGDRIVESMNLYRAGQNVPSLGSFIDEVTAKLQQIVYDKR